MGLMIIPSCYDCRPASFSVLHCVRRTVMGRITNCILGFCCAVVVALLPMHAFAQTSIVIEGGTLIDGNGGAPVPDSVIIIQGNKIAAVSRKGQASYPPGVQVIKADGKFVLPGLIDGQVSYSW